MALCTHLWLSSRLVCCLLDVQLMTTESSVVIKVNQRGWHGLSVCLLPFASAYHPPKPDQDSDTTVLLASPPFVPSLVNINDSSS